mmetsp:Transcript_32948/g.49748  ORF Transcript_32948/g.49748 Transcript_32948/m.49748 type:complete len:206 (-) Transcript_32948:101-718(-)|eukprot:CAMPEP_0178922426 /NCGR_PEP_ID=MMETSP0786-20121207/16147_1 /TAXON_ID=186022 /ORGANISM="Thalassionema frauenfeldii, Strain CCMP 1798" /LENGTH=205 /DNA_ID=CAMNT_0020596789 /DNA_START=90 /DNA_END=710 /DNA_ORIENTATION=+
MSSEEQTEPQQDTTTMPEQKEEELSALRDNIAKKGKNAYYFAHSNTPTGPKWDGKQKPKLLHKKASSKDMLTKSISSFDLKSNITSYAFSDGDKSVKLYIDKKTFATTRKTITKDEDKDKKDEEGEENATPERESTPFLEEHEVDLQHTQDSLSLRVPSQDKCLLFAKLAGNITSAKFKLKEEYLVLILKKETPGEPWASITSKS